MTLAKHAYARGRVNAWAKFAKAPALTNPTVANSTLTNPSATRAPVVPDAPAVTPQGLTAAFGANAQLKSQTEPKRKISAEICTSCRKPKHYGNCNKPLPIKNADFNLSMRGSDAGEDGNPSTSPHYHAATSSVSSLAQAQEGRPADEQARGQFADLLRASRDAAVADQAARSTGALSKVSASAADGERRGPSVNPYAERRPAPVPSQARGRDAASIWDAFASTADAAGIDGNGGTPAGGPAV